MGEKITSQLQEILNRLTSVERRLQKIEGLCEKITNLEKAVNKTQAELNSLHEMADITNKKVIKEANSIKYDFIWKGKDKVKRSSLISDIEHGGLKAPHLESIIKTQRILCCKKFASDQLSAWKTFLLHYLKPTGGKFILCCDFDMNKLPINLPKYHKECLQCFAECSGTRQSNDNPSHEDISKTAIWNNKFICIHGKSVYNKNLVSQKE